MGRPTGFTSLCGSWSRARNFSHQWPATVGQPNSKPYAHFPQANPLVLTTLHGTGRVKLSSRASGISAHPISSHPVNMSQCLISFTPPATKPATTRKRTPDIALIVASVDVDRAIWMSLPSAALTLSIRRVAQPSTPKAVRSARLTRASGVLRHLCLDRATGSSCESRRAPVLRRVKSPCRGQTFRQGQQGEREGVTRPRYALSPPSGIP